MSDHHSLVRELFHELFDLSEEERDRVTTTYDEQDAQAGRDVLKFAVRFPAILVIAFSLIFLYFRSRGGYKPIDLLEEEGRA